VSCNIAFVVALNDVLFMNVIKVLKEEENTVSFFLVFYFFLRSYENIALRTANVEFISFLLDSCWLYFDIFAYLLYSFMGFYFVHITF